MKALLVSGLAMIVIILTVPTHTGKPLRVSAPVERETRNRPPTPPSAPPQSQPTVAEARTKTLHENAHGRPRAVVKPLPPSTHDAIPAILVTGSYYLENAAMIYDSEAVLWVWNDVMVSSPNGVMVSDLDRTLVVGDLKLERSDMTIEANDATVDVSSKVIQGKSMRFTRPRF